MKRFKFPLQRVLRLRAAEEESARRALLQAVRRLRDLEEGIDSVVSGLAALGEVSAAERAYRPILDSRAVTLRGLAGETRLALEPLREAFLGKRRDRRSLETVKEKAVARHALDSARDEAREMDEIGRTRFARAAAERAR